MLDVILAMNCVIVFHVTCRYFGQEVAEISYGVFQNLHSDTNSHAALSTLSCSALEG